MKEIKINIDRMGAVLDRLFLFRSLDTELKEEFLKDAVVVIADKGEIIIREGDVENTIFILIEGELEVRTMKGEEDIFLSLLRPNAIIGEISAIEQKPRTATVIAASPCLLIKISAQLVSKIISSCPAVRRLLETVKEGREKDTEEKKRQ